MFLDENAVHSFVFVQNNEGVDGRIILKKL